MKLENIQRVYNSNLDIEIDTFLTPDKIEYIAKSMMYQQDGKKQVPIDNQATRDYICNILLAKMCTNIGDDYEYGEHYNELMYNHVFETIKCTLSNYSDIQRYIDKAESINVSIQNFLGELIKYLNKSEKDLKKFDIDKAQKLMEQYGNRK